MAEISIRVRVEPPEIEGPRTTRLAMQPLGPAQQAEVAALHQDGPTMEWLAGPRDPDWTRGFLAREADHWQRHGFGLWALRRRADGRFLGRGGLRHTVVAGDAEVELAYAFHSEHWGLGLASELAETALAVGFERLGLARITCFTQPHNRASRRVMEKAGFVYERDIVHAGLPHVLYGLHPAARGGPGGPGEPGYQVRAARAADLPALAAVERAAGKLFVGTLAPESVLGDVTDPAELREGVEEERLFVAEGPGARPVGFALVEELDASLHLAELSVDPAHGRRGLGGALISCVVAKARQRGLPVTLTTFRSLPWNAPYYTGLGFRALDDSQLDEELAGLVTDEAARGLPARDRVVMRLDPRG